ncbi:MAG: peptidase [Proteobacteria bacterium]|nr:peptidase [Pseudomonadota bacterium]
MTYCLGVMLNDGLVMMSDSRTNAGVDNISTYTKMTVWEEPGERAIVLMSAGNLAITQAVIQVLNEGKPGGPERITPENVPSMTEAARLVGWALREIEKVDGPSLRASGAGFSASFILSGQIRNRQMRMFQIYGEGNFIQAMPETPYLQIGEHKYGKPILDRVINFQTPLIKAAKCALVSMDSTIKSNLTVAPPIDMLLYERDALKIRTKCVLADDDTYWNEIRLQWAHSLEERFAMLPDPNW